MPQFSGKENVNFKSWQFSTVLDVTFSITQMEIIILFVLASSH